MAHLIRRSLRVLAAAALLPAIDLFAKSLSPILDFYRAAMGGSPEGKLAILASVAPYADGR
ncbi:MAG: hypothetical protein M3167_14480 [Acidobacteriota bacterium]|nr:hypothetical protein [Acidobacteriota bacterium]